MQTPRTWFNKFESCLVHLAFTCNKADNSLFIKREHKSCIYIFVYVDDIIVTSSDPQLIKTLVQQLNKEFALKDLGRLSYFLGF